MKRKAYVTFCVGDYLFGNTLVLYFSLKSTGAQYPLIVLTTTQNPMNETNLHILDELGIEVLAIDSDFSLDVERRLTGACEKQTWGQAINKLNLFGLVDFEKIVYLDSDVFVKQNLDYLFSYPHMSAVLEPIMDHLNSGLMVIEPSVREFNRIKEKYYELTADPDNRTHDQDIIQQVYDDWFQKRQLILPWNTCPCAAIFDYDYERVQDAYWYESSVKAIHFFDLKPQYQRYADIVTGWMNNTPKGALYYLEYRFYWNYIVDYLDSIGLHTDSMWKLDNTLHLDK